MERTDHEAANSRLVGTNSYPLLEQRWNTGSVFHTRDFRKEILFLMAASILVRHCVICKQEIPAARLQVSPNTIACSPEHSRCHKQNLVNALRRRQRAERRL